MLSTVQVRHTHTHTRGGREANKVAFGYLFVQINVSYTGFEANFGDFSVFGARF